MPWSGCSCEAARTAWCKGGRAPRKGVEPAHCHFVDALRSNRVLHRGADGRVLCCRFDFMHRDGWKPRIRLGCGCELWDECEFRRSVPLCRTELMADFPADERAQVDANHLLSVFTSAGANLFLLTSMIISRAVGAEYDCWRMSRDVSGAFAMDPSVSFALGPEVSLTMAMHDDPADFISTRYRIGTARDCACLRVWRLYQTTRAVAQWRRIRSSSSSPSLSIA